VRKDGGQLAEELLVFKLVLVIGIRSGEVARLAVVILVRCGNDELTAGGEYAASFGEKLAPVG
jgi:hypothetical protein